MSNASDNQSPPQKSQLGTPEKAFNWKVSALIGVKVAKTDFAAT
ncbi:hypothetical protein [Nostoc commune]|nr:hypothetical protein [Nostoc commune]